MPPRAFPYKYPPVIGLPTRPYPKTDTDADADSWDEGNPNRNAQRQADADSRDQGIPNPYAQRRADTNTQVIPANQAKMDHPDPGQEGKHPVVINKNVPEETPSKFAAKGLEQMVIASPSPRPRLTLPLLGGTALPATASSSPIHRLPLNAMPVLARPDDDYDERSHQRRMVENALAQRERRSRQYNLAFAVHDMNKSESLDPAPSYYDGDVGLTPTRNTRADPPLVQTPAARMPPPKTPASRMPPPTTPASRMKVPQSPASRLLRPTPSPAYVVRSTGAHDDEVNATPGVVRVLFPSPNHKGVNATPGVQRVLFPAPSPKPNASEHPLVRPRASHDPFSRQRSVSFASALDEDMEMASPNVATAERPTGEINVTTTPQSQTGETKVITPEYQTGGTPPIPHTPRTPRTWISPSQMTPAIEARMHATPVYEHKDPDEPMEMTPSPQKSKPVSPDDRKMEDAFWTPSKHRASLDVAGLREKVAAAENSTSMEDKSPIGDSVPFGVAVAQDAMSLGTTTVKTRIWTEITKTIKTPSPLQSPTPAPRPTDNRRRNAAKPTKKADAPRREVASTPQRKGNGGAEQNKNRKRSTKPVIPGGINRRQELRTEPRYSLRDSTRGIMPGTYSLTPVRNRVIKAESPSKSK